MNAASRPPVRILLIESDPDFARLMSRSLEGVEWAEPHLGTVSTLSDALARIARGHVDIVVTNLETSDSRGLATVRALCRASQLPVIVLAADDEIHLREPAKRCGACDFIAKKTLGPASFESAVRLAMVHGRAQKSLEDNERRLIRLMQLSSDWYWEQDAQLRFTKMEGLGIEGVAARMQRPMEDAIGKRRWELGLQLLSGQTWEQHRNLVQARQPFRDLEIGYLDPAGQLVRVARVSGEPLFAPDGAFMGYHGVGRDITERYRIEQELSKKKSELQLIMDSVPARIARVDAKERYLYSNRAHAAMYGGDPATIIGRTVREVLGPDAYERTRGERARVLEGKTVSFVRGHRRPDGEERTLSMVLVPDFDPSGEAVGFYSLSMDVTEQKRAEAELRTTVSLLSATLESTADGILVVAEDQRIAQFNRRFVEMWRIPPQVMESRDDDLALRAALEQLKDPDAFVAKVKELYAHPEASSFDTIEFLDGRVFERYSRPQYVGGRASGRVWSFRDVTERKRSEAQIHALAYHDTLTELPNRVLFKDRMGQATAHADRAGTKVALLFLDLDNFKTINDSLGHVVGDTLLRMVAARLHQNVRDTDTISRQGGDEFLVMLTNLPEADAATPVLQKLMDQFNAPFEIEGNELSTTASIGVAIYPDDGTDFDALLRKADTAMYRAKDAGKSAYRFFDAQMNVEAVEHLSMRNGLRSAVKRGELVLHYQPQLDLSTGKVLGAEALIRWNHPQYGLVTPGRFIPVAEESGLIVPIGEWVLQEASRQAAAWRKAGRAGMVVAVNLSAVQFVRGKLEESVLRALAESGIDASMLELELTESILIRDTEATLATVKRLKSLGVRLSIDDFGTGYSSLSYLKRFEVDKLKIDQSFISALASTDSEDATIVRSVIQMAHSLGLRTIAEGVEDAVPLKYLRELRCDEAQGYYFGHPMPGDEFSAYLSSNKFVA